jgi:hypothetical protein
MNFLLLVACSEPAPPPPPPVPLLQREDLEQLARFERMAERSAETELTRIAHRLEGRKMPYNEARLGFWFYRVEDIELALNRGELGLGEPQVMMFRDGQALAVPVYHVDQEAEKAAKAETRALLAECLAGRCPERLTFTPYTRSVLDDLMDHHGGKKFRSYEPDPEGHLRYTVQYYGSGPDSEDLAYAEVGPGWWVLATGDDHKMYHVAVYVDVPFDPPLHLRR